MKKILIVDDEPDSIAVFEFLLSQLNYEVVSISNPNQTIETIYKTSPDLIILDWIMPQKEGIEVLKEIKAIPEMVEIPVIISSGLRTQSNSLKEALLAGAIDLIKKPIDELELEARIHSSLQLADYTKEKRKLQEQIHLKELKLAQAQNKRLKAELSKRERETIVSAVNILHKKKQLGNLKSEIVKQIPSLSKEQKDQLTEILIKHEQKASGFNWELFKRRFAELNTDFYKNLALDHPNLSSTEQNLCAYFKLGLTPKEIAVLTVSNYVAVRKAIYRLRKSLAIEESVELQLYFQAY